MHSCALVRCRFGVFRVALSKGKTIPEMIAQLCRDPLISSVSGNQLNINKPCENSWATPDSEDEGGYGFAEAIEEDDYGFPDA